MGTIVTSMKLQGHLTTQAVNNDRYIYIRIQSVMDNQVRGTVIRLCIYCILLGGALDLNVRDKYPALVNSLIVIQMLLCICRSVLKGIEWMMKGLKITWCPHEPMLRVMDEKAGWVFTCPLGKLCTTIRGFKAVARICWGGITYTIICFVALVTTAILQGMAWAFGDRQDGIFVKLWFLSIYVVVFSQLYDCTMERFKQYKQLKGLGEDKALWSALCGLAEMKGECGRCTDKSEPNTGFTYEEKLEGERISKITPASQEKIKVDDLGTSNGGGEDE